MLGELVNIPTDTLIDMLLVILASEPALNADDVAEIDQIQCELQRRSKQSWTFGKQSWSFGRVN